MNKTGVVEWSVRSRTLPGETFCGDRCLVMEVWEGVLVAVIDGIGHGEEAAKAAQLAAETIEAHADRSFSLLLQECHGNLQKTRGVVMSLAYLDNQRTMTWMGVGNVEGRLIRGTQYTAKSESLLLRTGIIGGDSDMLPTFYPRGLALVRGDLLIMATDGIKNDFDTNLDIAAGPRRIAEGLIANKSKPNDDALVFVGRYTG
jgi:negative regulator of sigma-B (phosphoserine phosphatase)